METVLPRPEALRYVKDAQQLGLINLAASSTYRDTELNLLDIGNKVRKLIAEHIDTLRIRSRIPPVDIHDINFQDKLRSYRSDETNALRWKACSRLYRLSLRAGKILLLFATLSDRLQDRSTPCAENWDLTVDTLDKFIKEITILDHARSMLAHLDAVSNTFLWHPGRRG